LKTDALNHEFWEVELRAPILRIDAHPHHRRILVLYPISEPIPGSLKDLSGYINVEGNVVIRPSYSACAHFFEGIAAVIDESGKSGFIDHRGQLAIPFHFDGLGVFRSGLCAMNGGYIDHSGKWQIDPRFIVQSAFSEGRAFVSMDGEAFGFIDFTGNFVIPPIFRPCRHFSEGLAAVRIDERWGYIDRDGGMVIPACFDGPRATGFHDGLAGVRIDERWGFVDRRGRFVIRPEYEELRPFFEGHACVQKNGKWGLIDSDGRYAVECRFEELRRLDGGVAAAKLDGKAGFISRDDHWVIAPTFEMSYTFFHELAIVRRGETYSYIRRDGKIVWTSCQNAKVQFPPAPFFV
jgi:hypothetical protein